MKRYLLTLFLGLASLTLMAQSYGEDGYNYLYDYDHRVVVRKCVACTDDYQDLWNGDHVRFINNTCYIYRGNTRITYGDRIWLEHTGDYTVERSGTMYLQDSDGDYSGVYGTNIYVLWNGICDVTRNNGYHYLYTRSNYRLGSVYSTESISLYWNGCYCYRTPDGYYRVADEDGNPLPNNYSQEEPTLTTAGYFRYLRSGNYYVFDLNGNRVY